MEYVQIDKKTGSLFKKERDKRGLTLEEMENLTKEVGRRISKSTISSLETNDINYTTKEKIRVILRALESEKLRDYEFSIIPKRGSSQTSRTATGEELLKKEQAKEDKMGDLTLGSPLGGADSLRDILESKRDEGQPPEAEKEIMQEIVSMLEEESLPKEIRQSTINLLLSIREWLVKITENTD